MKSNLKLAIKTALFGSALLTATAASATDKELLDTLLSNGSITQAQYDNLTSNKSAEKKNKTAAAQPSNSLSDVKVTLDKKGLRFTSADEAFKMKIGGRMHLQTGYHVGDHGLATNGTEVRRARIHIKGVLWNDWKYVSELDFADNKVTIKDMLVNYQGLNTLQITLGNQKQNMSMELQESTNDIMFIERSLVNGLTEKTFNRALGLDLKSSGKDWSVQLGIYGDDPTSYKNAGDEGWGVSSRATYTPIHTKNQVLHIGGSVGYRGMDADDVKLGYETTHMSNLYLTKATVANVNGMTMGIAELAYMYGPFSLQSEYAHMWLDRDAGESGVNFDAWYVQAAWTLTGESRSYKGSDGEFKRLKSSQEFGFGQGSGWGAFELALRYDEDDLNSGDIVGGTEKAFTFAANWYLNQNVRLMADYRNAFDVSNSPAGNNVDNIHAFTARVQLTF